MLIYIYILTILRNTLLYLLFATCFGRSCQPSSGMCTLYETEIFGCTVHAYVLCNAHMPDDGRQERPKHVENKEYNKSVMPHS